MGRSFRSRVALLTLGAVAVTLAVAWTGVALVVLPALRAEAAARLESQARLLAEVLPAKPTGLQAVVSALGARVEERITVIADDGTVLADSRLDPLVLDNHATRPEIVEARARGVGASMRTSGAAGPSLYVALRADDAAGGRPRFVRVAVPAARVDAPLRALRAALLVAALAGAVAALLSAAVVARWLRARARGLAAYADAVSHAGGAPPPLGRTPDELEVVERALAATAADLSTYVAALAEQRRRIEAIIGSMDEGLIVVTGGGEVLLMNTVAERMLDVRPEAWRGRTLLELTRHAELHALLARAGAEGRASGELRLPPPRDADLAVSVAPLRGPAPGETLGCVVVLRDVTRLKRLERMRTDFVANVTHELKTPLAAIRAALETLHDWALEDPAGARRWVAMSLGHAERLQRLIDDLLVLSDLELRQVQLVKRRVDLGGAVDETFGLLAAKAAERGVALVKTLPPDFPPLVVDRNRLIQILLNLVDNAVKYTQKGGTVTVSAETLPDGMQAVAVTDTGVGVPRAEIPRLGERFYRVDKGRSRDAGGTGLGLAIVKHLVQTHGGRLEIASEVGRGTTVRVLLPPGEAEEAPAHSS